MTDLRLPSPDGVDVIDVELFGAREMDGVERSELGRRQQAGRIEDSIVDPQEVHPREHLPASSYRFGAEGQERTDDLGAGKGTRRERPMPSQVPPQRRRLRFANGELHER